ncbi:MAG TPA: c-type cytochrome [Bryobacteraceae bacterium]|nr:c-type cytochrome [Bryobacteraceae bacterium]
MRLSIAIPALLAAASLATAQERPTLAKGKRLFSDLCSRCHGLTGGGGEGPNLNRPVLERAPDDKTLANIIREGIPNTGMPRIRRFTDPECDSLILYVRSLGKVAPEHPKGDAQKGSGVYARLGCSGCHTIAGEGGNFGPELSSIGAYRSPENLRQSIVEPAAALPKGVMLVPGRGFSEYLPVRVVTHDGQEIRGIRVNEDSFTIQVKDMSSRLYSFRKSDLQTLDKELGQSMMPNYTGKVSGADLDDLVAYLWSRGGSK